MRSSGSPNAGPMPSAWPGLTTGTPVTIVKLAPDGSEAARYPGVVVARREPGAWVVVRATWTHRELVLDGLSFRPDDVLLEWFSPRHYYNAFAVFSPDGRFSGWYGNVAMPATLRVGSADQRTELIWHDLYLDLIGLPNGQYILRDADELLASPLIQRDSGLLQIITGAESAMRTHFLHRQAPFVPEAELRHLLGVTTRHRGAVKPIDPKPV
jgi:hypothetical protein